MPMSFRWSDVWGDSRDAKALAILRCATGAFASSIFLYLGALKAGVSEPLRSVVAVALSIPVGVAMHIAIEFFSASAAAGLSRATGLSGHGDRRGTEHSHLLALVHQGRLQEALDGFEQLIAAHPSDAGVRLHAADVYARDARNAARAASLFREARELFLARRAQRNAAWHEGALYATQRLLDLYDGPLESEGRSLVELRRLIELFPGTREAAGAREALVRRKREPHGRA
jgi:hypothetical protein